MKFTELLQSRRAIRDYKPKEVPLETIKEIIQESTLAPSASNGQPCQFIIIRNKQTMKKLSDESKKNLLQDFAESKALLASNYVTILKNESFNVFYNAPCVIYVVGAKSVDSLDVDCALAVSYIMFSAAQRGLGTCWIGLAAHIRDPKIKAEIGIPDNCQIIAPVIIGYPKAIPAPSERNAPNILKIIN